MTTETTTRPSGGAVTSSTFGGDNLFVQGCYVNPLDVSVSFDDICFIDIDVANAEGDHARLSVHRDAVPALLAAVAEAYGQAIAKIARAS
jgi:hypothetical protein